MTLEYDIPDWRKNAFWEELGAVLGPFFQAQAGSTLNWFLHHCSSEAFMQDIAGRALDEKGQGERS